MSDSYHQILEAKWKEGIDLCFRKEQFSLTNIGIVCFLNISVTRFVQNCLSIVGKCYRRRHIALDYF